MSEPDKQQEQQQQQRVQQQSLPLTWDSTTSEPATASSQDPPVLPAKPVLKNILKPAIKPKPITAASAEPAAASEIAAAAATAEAAEETEAEVAREVTEVAQMTSKPPAAAAAPLPAGCARIVTIEDVRLGLGETLMQARGAANMSIAQASQKTHIRNDIIEAFENENFERLPPALYARSYLRQLCQLYKISGEELQNELNSRLGGKNGDRNNFVVNNPKPSANGKLEYEYNLTSTSEDGAKRYGFSTRVVIATALGGLALLSLVIIISMSVGRTKPTVIVPLENITSVVQLEKFIIPQQLPMDELPIPLER